MLKRILQVRRLFDPVLIFLILREEEMVIEMKICDKFCLIIFNKILYLIS